MQRKNRLLKRSGMAMIMAITVIIVIATIMALNIAMTTQTTKRTSDLYLYEQSILLSKSAAEYALLQISQNTTPCAYTGNSFTQDSFYNIDISVQYIYTAGVCITQYATVTTPEQNGSVILDIAVSVTDTSVTTEPIRYFRRTIQKL